VQEIPGVLHVLLHSLLNSDGVVVAAGSSRAYASGKAHAFERPARSQREDSEKTDGAPHGKPVEREVGVSDPTSTQRFVCVGSIHGSSDQRISSMEPAVISPRTNRCKHA
jgi:hypothetical protein